MSTTNDILDNHLHRPYAIPSKSWTYYQEWNKALFLHWEIEHEMIRELLPQDLEPDLFNGKAWISVVAFTMEKIRPKYLPSFSPVSDFHEINVRTYVTKNGKPGVYFLNIEAQKLVSVVLSKALSGLPYEKSKITRELKPGTQRYHSDNKSKGFKLKAEFTIGPSLDFKTELDRWLTERYCLYLVKNEKLIRYEIHHKEWEIDNVEFQSLEIGYQLKRLNIDTPPALAHYSKGVKVIAWGKEFLN